MDPLGEKDVTTLLAEWSNRNREALNRLTPLVYNELRQLADRQRRRERRDQARAATARMDRHSPRDDAYFRIDVEAA